ncbi:MAG: hypothetical protein GYB65_07290 [Chloroflexi bacterium]|nr:hypothetical protein [Chloroflexota bacterium]
MADFQVEYRWDTSHAIPILFITVSGHILTDAGTIPGIIDKTHALVEKCGWNTVYLVYDICQTEGRLPLNAMMSRSAFSSRVRRVIVVGAKARTDEMAVLIMGAAKQVPYDITFCDSLDNALSLLYGRAAH